MPPSDASWRLWCRWLAGLCLAWPAAALADANSSGRNGVPQSAAATVEQLLQLDSQAALDKARERASSPPVSLPTAAARAVPGPALPRDTSGSNEAWEVLAILGPLGLQQADLAVQGQLHRGLRVGSPIQGFVVQDIGRGCIQLKSATTTSVHKRLCFSDSTPASVQPSAPGAMPMPMPMPLPMSHPSYAPAGR